MLQLVWPLPRRVRAACRRLVLAAAVAAVFSSTLCLAANPYAPDAEYPRGAVVLAADGNEYRTLETVKGKDPITAKSGPWRLAHAAFDTTLDVPGRFDSLERAFAFIAGASISDTAKVTVQVAPGTYDLKGPLPIGQGHGRRVVLKGGQDPAKTLLRFGRGAGLVLDDARGLRIEGLTMEGGQTGIVVDHGSYVSLAGVILKNFRISVLVENGSTLIADGMTVETDDGDWGVKVTSTSRGQLTRCTISRTKPRGSAEEHTFGVDSETGASVECRNCEVSGWVNGVLAGRSGSLGLWETKATGNVHGGSVYLAGVLSAFDSTFDKNLERGVQVHGGAAQIVNCQLRGNRKMGISSSSNAVVDFMGQPTVVSGSEYGLHSFRGGRFHGVRPQLKDNGEDKDVFPAGSTDDDPFLLN
jgi:hypothetical protein